MLFTDKTGTLTLGRIDYMRAVPAQENIDPDSKSVLESALEG